MAVTLPESVLERYPRLSQYNSPYVAHDAGCAVDLYPETGPRRAVAAPSPVAGEVLDTRSVRAPPKPYAAEQDHLLLVELADDSPIDAPPGTVARLLHVDPAVEAGDHVAVGDSLGTLVRAGFFAPWVDNHIHLGFRAPDANPYRASGSMPIALDCDPLALDWDGTGTVREAGGTSVVLDSPVHPEPGRFAGIASETGGVLDGGLVHYDGGGVHGAADGPVTLLGREVGVAEDGTVAWNGLAVFVDDDRVTGLSLFLARDDGFGAKVVCPGHTLAVGDVVRVTLEPTDDPTVLG
ncbi:hypothetical protein [Halomarina oriensis]|uniref:Uncharacterized protein n=1 Tax=Halomarina oriensis TaxID=671145 RepID=A0A6B0GQL9_9EURY|nr:hypothetical protein [Halomarina oriensis]MWG34963.1 hypothetical protein [Halomarina oriensis]